MKFYKNKWFWALVVFVILSISWNSYISSAVSKNPNHQEESSVNEKNNISTDTKPLVDENEHNTENGKTQELTDKLNKVKELQALQSKREFMLTVAQDDLEHYSWGEDSQYPDIWKQAYLKYKNGNQIMLALQYDVDTYITFGKSDYSLLWASADLSFEAYKMGKLQSSMSTEKFQKLEDNLKLVHSRLGVIYAKREYIPQFNNQSYQQPQQAPY